MKFRVVSKMNLATMKLFSLQTTLWNYTTYCFEKGMCVHLCGVDIVYWRLSDWTCLQYALHS